jgi:hypothetical protein
MSERRRTIIQRAPVFLGCEGDSEQAYGQLLNDLIKEAGKAFHIEVVNLNPGAGDPAARVRRAIQEIARREQRRSEFRFKAILMDIDQVHNDPERRLNAEGLAREQGLEIIWQEPCHEAFLLRHLEGFAQRRPPTSALALRVLRSTWPEYQKPMTKMRLARKIALEAVHRAAAVEPTLSSFLHHIALLPAENA